MEGEELPVLGAPGGSVCCSADKGVECTASHTHTHLRGDLHSVSEERERLDECVSVC